MKKASLKTLAILMAVVIAVLCLPDFSTTAYYEQKDAIKVAYIPIDNRPVNYQRVQWLAESIGIELLMPDEQLFRTALDNMQPNDDGTNIGNRTALLNWIKSLEGKCDYYVISLDQMLSGGLVSSRAMTNTDLSFEFGICDYIAELSKKHTVILFDTVMRLASTVTFNGYGGEDYNKTRLYGSQSRKRLSGDDLTLENIIAGYRFDEYGKTIASSLSEKQLNDYIASRTRKLKLADYMLRNAAADLDFCFIGVDDSTPGNSIQSNEIDYIRSLLGENCNIAAATDEFGMLCIARIAYLEYGSAEVNVKYYGGGENNIADEFDFDTLKNDVDGKLRSLGCKSSDSADALNILIVTRSNNNRTAAENAIKQAKKYLDEGKCVAICDPNTGSEMHTAFLTGNIDCAKLLGYSSWNTAANALGICLSMSIARYLYLKNEPYISPASHDAFLKSITFALVKDISYKKLGRYIDKKDDTQYGSYNYIINMVNKSDMIVSLQPYKTASHGTVSADNYRYPWDRTFEMVFDIDVQPIARDKGDINGDNKTDLLDYIICQRIINGYLNPDTTYDSAADVNGDGIITSKDASLIKECFANN